jgi:hypothetical protein
MTRRLIGLLITLGLLVALLAVEEGMVSTPARFQAEFREALRARGYVEGQTILATYRWVAAGQTYRLHDLAVELVHLPVDLIVAFNTPAAQAAKRATTAVPIAAWPEHDMAIVPRSGFL